MRISDLFEAFTSTPAINLDGGLGDSFSHGQFATRFTAGRETYTVYFEQNGEMSIFAPDVWCVSFRQSATPGFRPTGNVGQDATAVLGGVVHAIKTFIAEYHPEAIGFTGKRADRLGRLYNGMVKRLSRDIESLGYHVHETPVDIHGILDATLLYRTGKPADFMITN